MCSMLLETHLFDSCMSCEKLCSLYYTRMNSLYNTIWTFIFRYHCVSSFASRLLILTFAEIKFKFYSSSASYNFGVSIVVKWNLCYIYRQMKHTRRMFMFIGKQRETSLPKKMKSEKSLLIGQMWMVNTETNKNRRTRRQNEKLWRKTIGEYREIEKE